MTYLDTKQIIAFTNTNCWKPNDNAGLELVIISFDEKSIKTFNRKIKEKFKILSEPKIAI